MHTTALEFFLGACHENVSDFITVAAGHGWLLTAEQQLALRELNDLDALLGPASVELVWECAMQRYGNDCLFSSVNADTITAAATTNKWILHSAHAAAWEALKMFEEGLSLQALCSMYRKAGITHSGATAQERLMQGARRRYMVALRAARHAVCVPPTCSAAPTTTSAGPVVRTRNVAASTVASITSTVLSIADWRAAAAAAEVDAAIAAATPVRVPPTQDHCDDHSLQGFVLCTYAELVKLFGPPVSGPIVCECDWEESGGDCPCIYERCAWHVTLDGHKVSIYDHKEASTCMELFPWHIGGSTAAVLPFVRKYMPGKSVTVEMPHKDEAGSYRMENRPRKHARYVYDPYEEDDMESAVSRYFRRWY
jgi:hypothetical protein